MVRLQIRYTVHPTEEKLYALSAVEALKRMKEDTLTAEQYVTSLIERANKRDGVVRGWTYRSKLVDC